MPPGQYNNDRDKVLSATDLVAVIGEQVRLEPKGAEYVGICPFHEDSRPSMCVVPAASAFVQLPVLWLPLTPMPPPR